MSEAYADEPPASNSQPGFRRLNEAQYRNAIADIFGSGIDVPGRFEPSLRDAGLLAIGDAKVSITSSGFEQYELRARLIAAQVLAPENRSRTLPCAPVSARAFDETCAKAFYGKYGLLLLRRPLAASEMRQVIALSRGAAAQSHDFHKALEAGLARLLVSPFFVFRIETADAAKDGFQTRLDDFSLATRLSFFLWNAPPDDELLDAAARGELAREASLERQVNRMIASPKFEQGVRSFFWDMFGYNQFNGLTKEQALYKKFVSQLAKDAEEQSLRTVVDHLVRQKGDYRDIFTTKQTFMNRRLAAVYEVPIETDGFDGWTPYTFPADGNRQGLLSLVGFLMLDPSHEGRSSPTNRGKFVRESLLCQSVPPPPANVDFALVQDTANPQFRTARDRLTAHQENPVCAGCHAITDPIGLSMENYDAIGQYRTHENGSLIDPAGDLRGVRFRNMIEMQSVLRDDRGLTECLAQRVLEYGVGRATTPPDQSSIERAHAQFARDGYRITALMRAVATSAVFQRISPYASAAHPGGRKERSVHDVAFVSAPGP